MALVNATFPKDKPAVTAKYQGSLAVMDWNGLNGYISYKITSNARFNPPSEGGPDSSSSRR